MRLSVYNKNIRAIQFYQREQFVIQSENTDDNTNEKELVMAWSQQINPNLQGTETFSFVVLKMHNKKEEPPQPMR